jgi:hypothetical protein
MLSGIVFFNLLGAQLFSSLFGAMGLSFLFFSPMLASRSRPEQGAGRRALLIGGALLAYSCGAQAMLHQLALAPATAAAVDQLSGAALVIPGGLIALGQTIWSIARRIRP